jgi:hypothetical protein
MAVTVSIPCIVAVEIDGQDLLSDEQVAAVAEDRLTQALKGRSSGMYVLDVIRRVNEKIDGGVIVERD